MSTWNPVAVNITTDQSDSMFKVMPRSGRKKGFPGPGIELVASWWMDWAKTYVEPFSQLDIIKNVWQHSMSQLEYSGPSTDITLELKIHEPWVMSAHIYCVSTCLSLFVYKLSPPSTMPYTYLIQQYVSAWYQFNHIQRPRITHRPQHYC